MGRPPYIRRPLLLGDEVTGDVRATASPSGWLLEHSSCQRCPVLRAVFCGPRVAAAGHFGTVEIGRIGLLAAKMAQIAGWDMWTHVGQMLDGEGGDTPLTRHLRLRLLSSAPPPPDAAAEQERFDR